MGIAEFMREWAYSYPVDRWWREKHKIPFNSKLHREGNHIDMAIEYLEDLMYIEIDERIKKKDKDFYVRGEKDIFKKIDWDEHPQEIPNDLFDKINWSVFDDLDAMNKKLKEKVEDLNTPKGGL